MGRGQTDSKDGAAISRRGNGMFPRETMIRYHLEHNVYPPLGFGDNGAVEFATLAIDAVNEGEPERLVEVTVGETVWQGHAGGIVEEWKLEHLLEADDEL